jgi:hypothetical protein
MKNGTERRKTMNKYDYKDIAAAKALLEQALELVQGARECLGGADKEEFCVNASEGHCRVVEEYIEDALVAMDRGMNGKDLAEAKLKMVIGRCKEMYGNVHQSDLMCSLCESKAGMDEACKQCAGGNGAEGFRLRNPWKE